MELGHFMIGHNLGAFTWVQVRFVKFSKSFIFSENFTFHFFNFLDKLINFVEGVDSAKINHPIQAG